MKELRVVRGYFAHPPPLMRQKIEVVFHQFLHISLLGFRHINYIRHSLVKYLKRSTDDRLPDFK